MKTRSRRFLFLGGVLCLLALLAACQRPKATGTPTDVLQAGTATATPVPLTPTPTSLPTATPVPLAAIVNDEGITQAEYEAELTRYQKAIQAGTNLATEPNGEDTQVVLDDLINQVLFAQGAYAQGYVQDEAVLQARFDALTSQAGGAQALEAWMTDYGYTPESFRKTLSRSLAVAWIRDQIITAVPETAEQVHARQILLYNSTQANDVLRQLQSGQDFLELAKIYDPATVGELGWFPQGYLTQKALEEAAFQLEPGQFSQVIQTPLGYHILFIVERDPARPLSPNTRLALQEQALSEWLQQRRAQSEIQVFTP